ncbi:MAG: DUF4412 domain-containing protein [Candidatus Omnitrophota bacterium]
MVKRLIVLSLLALSISLFKQGMLCAQKSFVSLRCDITVEHAGINKYQGELFLKGNKSRTEMNMSGMNTVTIMDGSSAYVYMPEQNIAMKVPVLEASEHVPAVDNYRRDCQPLGEEEVAGSLCSVYSCSKSGKSFKVWMNEDVGFPSKISGMGVVTYYQNIDFNKPLDDSLFILPEGAQVQDMGNILKGYGGQ